MFFRLNFFAVLRRGRGKEGVYRNEKTRKRSVVRNIPIVSRTNSGGSFDDYSRHAIDSMENYIFSLHSDAEACAFFISVTWNM